MEVIKYNYLPEDAIQIRTKVFIEEQNFKIEFDDIDNVATHLVLYIESEAIACCRFYWSEEKNAYIIGRIAVLSNYRGKSIGKIMIYKIEEEIKNLKGKKIYLAAQKNKSLFYLKQGYKIEGQEFFEEHCLHIWMFKDLETN